METKTAILGIITFICIGYKGFSQPVSGEFENIALNRRVPITISVIADKYADSVDHYIRNYLLEKRLKVIDKAELQELMKEYFTKVFESEKTENSSNQKEIEEEIKRKQNSSPSYAKLLSIVYSSDAVAKDTLKAKSLSWAVVFLPPASNKVPGRKIVDESFLKKTPLIEVIRLLLLTITTQK